MNLWVDFEIHEIKVIGAIFGECLNYKSGLRILIWPPKVPFFGLKDGHFLWIFGLILAVFPCKIGSNFGSKFTHKFMAEFCF